MGLFGILKENKLLKEQLAHMHRENSALRKLCEEKDSHFLALMSDGLRNKSSLAAKYMSDRRKYLNGK